MATQRECNHVIQCSLYGIQSRTLHAHGCAMPMPSKTQPCFVLNEDVNFHAMKHKQIFLALHPFSAIFRVKKILYNIFITTCKSMFISGKTTLTVQLLWPKIHPKYDAKTCFL